MAKTAEFVDIVRACGIVPATIFDVGCYNGEQALELALAFPQARIYAFEAVPELASESAKRCAFNDRVTVIPAAVGDEDGIVTFNESTSRNRECGSLLEPNGEYFEPMPMRKIKVPIVRLETAIEKMGIPGPDVMWMDVQGNESKVLEGMRHHIIKLQLLWCEVCYRQYYTGQMLVGDFDALMRGYNFKKVFESPGIPGWFGDACYRR